MAFSKVAPPRRRGGVKLMDGALRLALLFLGGASLFCGSAVAQVDGISYSIQPSLTRVQWNDALGIKDTEMLGGRLGIHLGRFVGLEAYYLGRNGVETRLSELDLRNPGGDPLPDPDLDTAHYGADLLFHIGGGPVVPFVRGGGGIIHFTPAGGDRTKQIGWKAGGGIRFGTDRFGGKVYVEDLAFRLDRYDLARVGPGGSGPFLDPEAYRLRHQITYGISFTARLGGVQPSGWSDTDRAISERLASGLSGLSVPVEPFVGSLSFHEDLGFGTQRVLGVRTGIDLGRYFGLRGFYWHGVEDRFDDTRPVSSWGGEARFNMGEGEGILPYVVAGLGHLRFGSDYRDERGHAPDDRMMLILGGGLAFPAGDRFRFNLAIRDHILSAKDLDATSAADDLFSNWMVSGGVTFSIGGASTETRRPLLGSAAPSTARPDTTRAPALAQTTVQDTTQSIETRRPPRQAASGSARGQIPPVRSFEGDRIIALPVPAQGEIYVRYGIPGGVQILAGGPEEGATPPAGEAAAIAPPRGQQATAGLAGLGRIDREEIRRAVREELDRYEASWQAAAAGGVDEAALDAIERRLAERLDRQLEGLRSEMKPAEARESDRLDREIPSPRSAAESGPSLGERLEIHAATGVNVDRPQQGIFGLRAHLGGVTRGSRIAFVPEIAVGLGSGGSTFLAAANLQYDLFELRERGSWTPYAVLGFGVLAPAGGVEGRSGTEGVLNFGYGLAFDLGWWTLFAEHQGVDLFDLHRLLVGARFGF